MFKEKLQNVPRMEMEWVCVYLRKRSHDLVTVTRIAFKDKIFEEIISMSIVLCLFIHNIGSKLDRETIPSKLTFMLLTLQASLLGEMSVNLWALFDGQLMDFIWKYVFYWLF